MRPAAGLLGALLAAALLCGCATREVCVKPVGARRHLTPAEVAVTAHGIGSVTTWGGQAIATRNVETGSELEILGYPLDACGRPQLHGQSQGRFLARQRRDLEPMEYQAGYPVTVTGRIAERAGRRESIPMLDESVVRRWPEQPASAPFFALPVFPWISLGIGSGYVSGGIGIAF